jgi:hypothetical protein
MSTRIGPADPRYRAVVDQRFNKRFSARPDYVRLATSTGEVVSAPQDAVTEGSRLVVKSIGCVWGIDIHSKVAVLRLMSVALAFDPFAHDAGAF